MMVGAIISARPYSFNSKQDGSEVKMREVTILSQEGKFSTIQVLDDKWSRLTNGKDIVSDVFNNKVKLVGVEWGNNNGRVGIESIDLVSASKK